MTLDRSSFSENAATPAATLTVRRFNTDRTQPITVVLSNPDPSELSLPPTLVIPANQESVSVFVTALDDNLLDGPQDILLRGIQLVMRKLRQVSEFWMPKTWR